MKRIFISVLLVKILVILMAFLISSCRKFVQIDPSPNLIQTEEIFADESAALSAVSGVYTQMRALSPSILNGSVSIYCGLSSDEFIANTSSFEYDAFYRNSVPTTSSVVNSQMWGSAYRIIYRTNSIIQGLGVSSHIDQSVKHRLIGEMELIRALCYFYLVNLFGDVPLITSVDFRTNERAARSSTEEIYLSIIGDLSNAVTHLPENYAAGLKQRPNKWMAAAFLAKVHLFRRNWNQAEQFASAVINSGQYQLLADLNSVFKNGSGETIWEIASPNNNRNTAEGGVFIPASSSNIPSIVISQQLLGSFENGDARKLQWMGVNKVNNVEYYYPFKYKRRTASPVEEFCIVMRLSEVYLIRSEARAHLNNLTGAASDLDLIRYRAGLGAIEYADHDSFILKLLKERQVELFGEWGSRWLDLKRTGLANSILAPIKEPPGNHQMYFTLYRLVKFKSTIALIRIPDIKQEVK